MTTLPTTHTVTDGDVAGTARRRLSVRLDLEWEQLSRRPAVVARARTWGVTTHPFRTLDELLRLAGYKVPATPEANEVLRRLVATAAAEPLAARIVLQRLLPGLLAVVRRERRCGQQAEAFEVLASEAWLAIASYRTDRRPTQVAARLLNDARHRAFTAPRRRRERRAEAIVPPGELDLPRMPEPGSAFEELTIVLLQARGSGLADEHLEPVRDYLSGRTAIAVAAARNVTPRTLRNRRHRAIENIRRLAA